MTGAPMPDGADAVVMVERTDARRRRRPGRSSEAAVPAGQPRPPGRRRPARRATWCSPPGDGAHARPPRRAGQRRRRRRCRACTRAPGRRAVHRRRAGRGGRRRWRPARSATPTAPTLLAAGGGQRLRGRRPRPRPRRRGRHHRGHRRGRRLLRRRVTRAACQHGRLRPREGGARPHRRHALDADRHPAGQAVRLRPGRERHAGVRPARQPGVVAGQLRAARPSRAALDDGPPRARPRPGCQAVADAAFARRPDGKIHFVRVRGRRDARRRAPRRARPAARAATTSAPWPRPTPWPWSPTATAWPRATIVAVLLLDEVPTAA